MPAAEPGHADHDDEERQEDGRQQEPHEGEDAAEVLRSRSPSPESDPRRCAASPEGDADEVHDEEELAEAALDADAGVGARDLLPSQGRAGG